LALLGVSAYSESWAAVGLTVFAEDEDGKERRLVLAVTDPDPKGGVGHLAALGRSALRVAGHIADQDDSLVVHGYHPLSWLT
jgi:hypothetical protein